MSTCVLYTYIKSKSGTSEIKEYFTIVSRSSKTPRISRLDEAELLVTNWKTPIGSSEQRRGTKMERKWLICAESFSFPLTLSLMRVPTLTPAIQLHGKKNPQWSCWQRSFSAAQYVLRVGHRLPVAVLLLPRKDTIAPVVGHDELEGRVKQAKGI